MKQAEKEFFEESNEFLATISEIRKDKSKIDA